MLLRVEEDLGPAHPRPGRAGQVGGGELAEGLKATVNSDDPAYFGGYIDANVAAARGMGLGEEQIVTLARNSFEACFAAQEQRGRWLAELELAAARPV